MARRRSSSTHSRRMPQGRRVTLDNTNWKLPSVNFNYALEPYSAVEDRRRWHPMPSYQRPMSKSATPAKYDTSILKTLSVSFQSPKKVIVCVRRQIRKEVLHAFRVTGKGGLRRPRRNQFSNIHC